MLIGREIGAHIEGEDRRDREQGESQKDGISPRSHADDCRTIATAATPSAVFGSPAPTSP